MCCVLCDYKEGPRDLWASIMEMEMETETKARHVSEEIIMCVVCVPNNDRRTSTGFFIQLFKEVLTVRNLNGIPN